MLPAGEITQDAVDQLARLLGRGDIIIDGGNSYYKDDIRRAKVLAEKGIRYVDVGTSGGVWGLERGYCMMIGGRQGSRRPSRPDLQDAGARHRRDPRTKNRDGFDPRAEQGYIHAGPSARATSSRWSTTASNTA